MGKRSSSSRQQVTEYRMSLHYGLCLGKVDTIRRIKIGDKVAWSGNVTTQTPIAISAEQLFGGERKEGGVSGTAYFLPGNNDQVLPENLAARFGLTSATAPGFRGFGSLFFVGNDYQVPGTETYTRYDGEFTEGVRRNAYRFTGFYWGHNTPFIREAEITVTCKPVGLDPSTALIPNEDFPDYPDANPAHIIFECLTDTDFGKGDPLSMFDLNEWNAVAQLFYDEKFGLSLGWRQQATIESFIDEIIDHVQAVLFIHPATGKWTIRPLRDDYDTELLDSFSMDNAVLKSFQRKAWGEIVNEVILTWTNPLNEKEETVTMQDLAAIAIQGNVSTTSPNMYGIRKRSLANVVCARELSQRSAPLAAVELETERANWGKLPGDVIRLDWSEHDLSGLVFRVMRTSKPSKSGKITVSLMEDIFSLTKPALLPDTSSQWEDPSEDPEEVQQARVFTLPYSMAAAIGQSVGEDTILYPNALTGILAHHSSSDVIEIELFSEVIRPDGRALYERIGAKPVAGYAILLEAFPLEATTHYDALPGSATGRTPVEGGLALIGNGTEDECELCLIIADPIAGWVLKRGAYDTVPRTWPAGTPIWFFDTITDVADTSRTRGLGESASYKILARTSKGTLDPALVSATSVTVSDRPHRPNRPANVKVNGAAFSAVSINGLSEVTVTWSRRNRLVEDSIPSDWDAADVLPEAGQTTIIRAVNSVGEELGRWTDVTGNSKVVSTAAFTGEGAIYLHLFSARDDLASLESYGIWLLEAGVSQPANLPNLGDLDSLLPGTSDLVEGGGNSGRNLCPDPYFQDPVLWGLGAGPWYSVSRAGSSYPAEFGTPKALELLGSHYSGFEKKTVRSSVLSGLFGSGRDLELSAIAKNEGSGAAKITLEVQFYKSDDGLAVGGPNVISWSKGDSGRKTLKITPPLQADAKRFSIYNEAGVAWSGNAAISDIQLVEYEVPSSGGLGGRSAADILADLKGRELEIEQNAANLIKEVLDRHDKVRRRRDEIMEGRQEAFNIVETERTERVAADEAEATTRTTQISAINGNIALVESNITTVATDLSALTLSTNTQISAINGNLAAVEGSITTVATDLSAEVDARTTAVATVAGNLSALQSAYNLTVGEVSSQGTLLNSLTATVNSQGATLSAVSSDLNTVEASVNQLTATRIQQVTAGSTFAGVMFSAVESGGANASDIRFAAGKFGYGANYADPDMVLDMVSRSRYVWNTARTHKTIEEDWADGRIRLRKADGTLVFDSETGLQIAGAPSVLFTQGPATTSALIGSGAVGTTWTTVAEVNLNSLPDNGKFDTDIDFGIARITSGSDFFPASGEWRVVVAQGVNTTQIGEVGYWQQQRRVQPGEGGDPTLYIADALQLTGRRQMAQPYTGDVIFRLQVRRTITNGSATVDRVYLSANRHP